MIDEKRPRGRPRDVTKRTAVLDAARTLFLTRGPEATLDEVAALAGVAKATLYANFEDKDRLVEEVIRREANATILDDEFESIKEAEISAALISFGIRYVEFINSRDLLGWDRLIASISNRSDLARRVFDIGPGRAQRLLNQLIANAASRGDLNVEDVERAADELTGLWLGFVNLEVKLGVRPPLTTDEIQQRVMRGVSIFLTTYRA
ncbi:TetR/AcrR family transcriptional regulator [Ensifer adhaerens]|uniref:TetR/AcrR family transcriptional regulator n=1 Tax=Ensifer adhaerens TaxID=106592 RepID=UPI001CBCBFF8|nr:TetR/AcrR family transcriptional regulator [Ensifer adhaerens]MBZ7924262.1 TetR/AcrR family transcriptional regulator [Ensifer adhaerens]UAX96485.1 TetR/AcrR family transcriptional regulator [Ensifer adhaerens]UAY04172.1 TetR/AcrR family transcriptional regulator [Ensifer adhaerens]UAY12158.1 TetR/AcrR family transcriptional regulator [Ensifer adhaerens]